MSDHSKAGTREGIKSLVARLSDRKRWSASEAKEILVRQHESGKSRKAFALEHGLPLHRPQYWKGKLSADDMFFKEVEEMPIPLHPVKLQPTARLEFLGSNPVHFDMEFVMPDGIKICLSNDFDADALRRALKVITC